MKKTKRENKKFYVIPIIYLLFVFGIILLLVYVTTLIERPISGETDEHGCLISSGYTWCESKQKCLRTGEEDCPSEPAEKMSVEEAMEIAQNSECTREGNLTEDYVYNEITKTWWIDLDIEKPGCHPACVVSEETRTAEINWRCTGPVIPPKSKFCGSSTYGTCENDNECTTGGCSGQVCQSTNEESIITTCEYRECYDASKYGLSCKCVKNKCQWE